MTQVMTPSDTLITTGQIAKWQELIGAALRKSCLPSGPVQQVLETGSATKLVTSFIADLRTAVESVSEMFSRWVTVDRDRSPQAALDATGRRQYVNHEVVDVVPRGNGREAEVFFFKPGRSISDTELEEEYKIRGLKPADPFTLAAVNEADPAFADTHPNGTHWQDADSNWCYAVFRRWSGGRNVGVGRDGDDWDGGWWFAGLRE